jgi:hypothetical protein
MAPTPMVWAVWAPFCVGCLTEVMVVGDVHVHFFGFRYGGRQKPEMPPISRCDICSPVTLEVTTGFTSYFFSVLGVHVYGVLTGCA